MVCGGESSPAFVSPLFDVASPGSVTVATELSPPPTPPPPPAAASGATKADNLAVGGATGLVCAAATEALALEDEAGAEAGDATATAGDAAATAAGPVDDEAVVANVDDADTAGCAVVVATGGGGISIKGVDAIGADDATAVFIMGAGGGAITAGDGIGATGVGSAVCGQKTRTHRHPRYWKTVGVRTVRGPRWHDSGSGVTQDKTGKSRGHSRLKDKLILQIYVRTILSFKSCKA